MATFRALPFATRREETLNGFVNFLVFLNIPVVGLHPFMLFRRYFIRSLTDDKLHRPWASTPLSTYQARTRTYQPVVVECE